MTDRREPTDEIRPQSKRLAVVYAWWELVGKVIAPITGAAVLALLAYTIHHDRTHTRDEIFHERVAEFMAVGPRLTPEMLADILGRTKLEVLRDVDEHYPPMELVQKVDRNTDLLNNLRVEMGSLQAEVRANARQLQRIEILLRNGD